MKLVAAMKQALHALEQPPGMSSLAIAQELDIDGLCAWRLDGFPLSFWYFERVDHVFVVRLVGQPQDPEHIEVMNN
ncbi:hypothetical protein [Roseateles sp. LYH14W]|uniref:Uncharacterized protein n=1 Tax=Pelomonas parva TaxID=3299032 RepID=A0ABW7EX57_9BURK